ncbi:hypothetical protein ACLOJK_004112 [Asimina triloba]
MELQKWHNKKRSRGDAGDGTEPIATITMMQKRGAIRRWEMDAEDKRTEERLEMGRWKRGWKDGGGRLRLRVAMGDRELGRRKIKERLEAGKMEEEARRGGQRRRRRRWEEVGDPAMGGWTWPIL